VAARRLEQHFVYNSLNTIAALIRTDPGRARELLFGFADLSRAADVPGDAPSTLARELDAVRGYLQLEQARFGRRLSVELTVEADAAALAAVAVPPLRVLAAVREVVQGDIEPRREGGLLSVAVRSAGAGCTVTVQGPAGQSAVIVLPASGAASLD
jgi:LytS/YehU family sensor histidine kinase